MRGSRPGSRMPRPDSAGRTLGDDSHSRDPRPSRRHRGTTGRSHARRACSGNAARRIRPVTDRRLCVLCRACVVSSRYKTERRSPSRPRSPTDHARAHVALAMIATERPDRAGGPDAVAGHLARAREALARGSAEDRSHVRPSRRGARKGNTAGTAALIEHLDRTRTTKSLSWCSRRPSRSRASAMRCPMPGSTSSGSPGAWRGPWYLGFACLRPNRNRASGTTRPTSPTPRWNSTRQWQCSAFFTRPVRNRCARRGAEVAHRLDRRRRRHPRYPRTSNGTQHCTNWPWATRRQRPGGTQRSWRRRDLGCAMSRRRGFAGLAAGCTGLGDCPTRCRYSPKWGRWRTRRRRRSSRSTPCWCWPPPTTRRPSAPSTYPHATEMQSATLRLIGEAHRPERRRAAGRVGLPVGILPGLPSIGEVVQQEVVLETALAAMLQLGAPGQPHDCCRATAPGPARRSPAVRSTDAISSRPRPPGTAAARTQVVLREPPADATSS